MKTEFEQADIEAIAKRVVDMLKPMIPVNRSEGEIIFDKETLAEYLHVDVSWINKQITKHAIPYFKMGKYTRFKKSDIDRWTETMKVEVSPYAKLL